MGEQQQADSLRDISDIKRIMERSSKFISLSGLSGVAAGLCALAGAYFGHRILLDYHLNYAQHGYNEADLGDARSRLLVVASIVLAAALLTAFIFTSRRARQNQVNVWDLAARKLMWNVLIPLVSGGLFILSMLRYSEWRFVAPACLIFYGLALVNGSKYTLTDIRYLGFLEIILGLINAQFTGFGLYFWAAGFGVLHIIYGIIMWLKYEKN